MTVAPESESVLVVTGNYPSERDPVCGTFVRTFVHAIVEAGARATVINPTSVFARRRGPYPRDCVETTQAGDSVDVVRPVFASFSVVNLGLFNTARLTQTGFEAAVRRSVRRLRVRPTMVYGHFLYQAGRAAVLMGEDLGVPSVVAVGEGTFWTVAPMGFSRARKHFAAAAGFVAVSSPIKRALMEDLGVPDRKIAVFPNGVNRSHFRPLDRDECRRELGLPLEKTLIAFVGAFDDLKGGRVLLEAAHGLPNIGLLFIGEGPRRLDGPETVFLGSVPHALVPKYLGASDVFALPSLEEGSSNAVVEAMACGLPIITSRADYMEDLVDEETAILVDPRDPTAVRGALELLLRDTGRRKGLGAAALRRSERLDIRLRAKGILSWMRTLRDDARPDGMGT